MPFTAQIRGSDRRVSILDPNDVAVIADPLAAFVCKACATEMRIRKGTFSITGDVARRRHFFHLPTKSDDDGGPACAFAAYSAGETETHMRLKQIVAADLQSYLPALRDDPATIIELERWLPEAGRIADIYLETRNSYRVAVEIQVSPLPAVTLEERTAAYLSADITPVWLFVESQVSPESLKVLDRLNLDRLMATVALVSSRAST